MDQNVVESLRKNSMKSSPGLLKSPGHIKTLGSQRSSAKHEKSSNFETKRMVANATKSSSLSDGSDLEYGYQAPDLPLKDSESSHTTPNTPLEPEAKLGTQEFDKQEKSSSIFSDMNAEFDPTFKKRILVKQPSMPTSIEQGVQNWASSKTKTQQNNETSSLLPVSDTQLGSDASYNRA